MLPSGEERRVGISQPGQPLRLRKLKTSEKKDPAIRQRLYSVGSTGSVGSVRSRAESETDYEDIVSPQPRYTNSHLIQPWLSGFEDTAHSAPAHVQRASSPLNPSKTRESGAGLAAYSTNTSPPANIQQVFSQASTSRRTMGIKSTLDGERTESMARRWSRWMVKVGLREWILPLSVAGSLWVRWVVGLGGYSGHKVPPMYGDYEAQRHWMEITIHLPFREWYSYDLQYWGLDYPPLTAYVSWFWGIIGHMINPSWFALDGSRGIETPESKVFMRASVISMDLLVYIPAVVWFTRRWWHGRSQRTQNIAVLTILFQPALILIDNGHFQYNSVMLGLTLLAADLFHSGHDLLGAVAFVSSLCFKQMALYYSPAIFAYLLGRCITLPFSKGLTHLLKIGIVTVLAFVLYFSPFLLQSFPTVFLQSLIRIFPFDRGLFEDKVANFWCATNVLVKWKNVLPVHRLPGLATLMTLAAILPPMGHILAVSWGLRQSQTAEAQSPNGSRPASSPGSQPTNSPTTPAHPPHSPPEYSTSTPPPTVALLPYALFNCSLAFFLFSFQVHEKSILLPLMPLTLIMSGRSELDDHGGAWEWGVLVNNVGVFSMWPLLKKGGLGLQYAALTFFWNYLIGYNPLQLPGSFVKLMSVGVYTIIGGLHLAESLVTPPQRLPDLFPVLNVLLCTAVFGIVWLWGMKKQLEAGWAVSGLPRSIPMKKAQHEPLASISPKPPSTQQPDLLLKDPIKRVPSSLSRRHNADVGQANGHSGLDRLETAGTGTNAAASLPDERRGSSLGKPTTSTAVTN